jgi:hypothetical protein
MDDMMRANAIARLATIIDAIDSPAGTGRPRLWSTIVMLQALWWLYRAGAAWKLLPVFDGCLRLARGRKRQPAAGILDTQSVKTGPQCGPRDYDAGKKVRGRKRLLLVDTLGLVHSAQMLPASIQDR